MSVEQVRSELNEIKLYNRYMYLLTNTKVDVNRGMLLVKRYGKVAMDLPTDLFVIWLKIYVDGLTQKQTAEFLGVCRSRVNNLHKTLIDYFCNVL